MTPDHRSPRHASALTLVLTGAAAFLTYFCMYGLRKPFTAASFEGFELFGRAYKPVLVTSQVLGYMLSKFVGVKVVSEVRPQRRAIAILGLIASAEVALVLFGLTPAPYNFVFLFLNGLPLGMVFGLVLGYLEGRRATEALSAGLCASFILADGFTKSVGAYLLQWGIRPFWMPAAAGLLFFPPLLGCLAILHRVPPPTSTDEHHRGERSPMNASHRRDLNRRWAAGLVLLIAMYTILSILRSLRADFAPELWKGLGVSIDPSLFTRTELWVGLGVVLVNGACCLITNNRLAFSAAMTVCLAGFSLILLALLGQSRGGLSPFPFVVLLGLGLYLPYVAVHTTVFERLIAITRERGTIVYLMALADAFGYLGYVAVMLGRGFLESRGHFLDFFLTISLYGALASILLVAGSWLYFALRHAGATSSQTTAPPTLSEVT